MDKNIKSIEDLIGNINNAQIEYKFQIKVVANSKNNSIDFLDDFIKIKIQQRAVEGKANKAIIEYLSKLLNISKTKISISHGEKSSIKTIRVIK